jgi:tRNA(fMet)-specific endonuclease VapC
MITYLLDSNTCVEYLRLGTNSLVTRRLSVTPYQKIATCTVVLAELLYGALRSTNPIASWTQVLTFTGKFNLLPFDARAATDYADIKAHLASLGKMIGPNDLLIAAIARSNGLILVTHNTAEFSRVPGLQLEDWQIP